MEITESMRKKERKEQRDNNAGEEVFCLWRLWIYHSDYRNKRKEEESRRIENRKPEYWSLRNIFEVLTSRVMKTTIKEDNCLTSSESSKKEKKEKLLRRVMVKIELKQEDEKEGIIVKVLLDSSATGLVMSLEFVKKNKFRKKRLNRLIYEEYEQYLQLQETD